MIKASLVLAGYCTEHLFRRSVQTYLLQDIDPKTWEVIYINDNSPAGDEAEEILKILDGIISYTYIRIKHPFGMRGNTLSFRTAIANMRGEIYCETTPETLFSKDTMRKLIEPHYEEGNERAFVNMKTYNLQPQMQLKIDTVNWLDDPMNCSKLEGWDDAWVQQNVDKKRFDTHQTCSMRKSVFKEMTDGEYFFMAADYGTDDPLWSGLRYEKGIKPIPLMEPMLIHMHHLPFDYFASLNLAPNLNRWNHTRLNYMQDSSGRIPELGTSRIWDTDNGKNPDELMSEEDKKKWREYDDYYLKSGGTPNIFKHQSVGTR